MHTFSLPKSLWAVLTLAAALTLTPRRATAAPADEVTVAIFCINDFHGAFIQDADKAIPGAPSVWQCLDSLKAVYPYHLTVSAGDNFGGSYFYNATHGALLPVVFNDWGVRLSAVGNHEFDDGPASLAAKWKDSPLRPAGWDIDYVCANVYGPEGVPSYMRPFATETIDLGSGKTVRVGLLGMLASSAKEQISARNTVGLTFSGQYPHVIDSLKALPEFRDFTSCNIRTLLVHIGTRMENGQPVWLDKNADQLELIRDTLFHSVLSGHSHEPVCGRINDMYPVTQGWWHGMYVSVMKYRIDTLTMTVTGAEPELVRVPLKRPEELSPGPRRLQAQIDSLLTHTKTAGGVSIGTPLTQAEADMPHDRMNKYVESEMGRLVCSAYSETLRQAAHLRDKTPVVGVSHFGSIRAGFAKGRVSVLDVGEALPFSNAIKAYRVSGKQLLALFEFGYNNQRYGWIQCSNLEVERREGHVTGLTYVSPKGKRVRIKPDSKLRYFLAADEFMTNGGDGYSPDFFPAGQSLDVALPATTDAFISFLRQQPSLPLKRP